MGCGIQEKLTDNILFKQCQISHIQQPGARAKARDGFHGHSLTAADRNENINECFGITDNIPDFLTAQFKRSLGRNYRNAMRLLERRAPISIRVNPIKSDISSILECLSLEGIERKKSKTVRYGINITGNPRRLTQIQAFKDGCFEVQDLHSQKTIEDLPVNEHTKVLDYCAGAGGKILSIACSLNGNGKFPQSRAGRGLLFLHCSHLIWLSRP